jgi:membrane fusion protein, multidrug efflux system
MLWAPREGEPGRCYQAQLANAQANLNRYTPLEQKGFATSQLLDTQEAQVAH